MPYKCKKDFAFAYRGHQVHEFKEGDVIEHDDDDAVLKFIGEDGKLAEDAPIAKASGGAAKGKAKK